MTSTTLHSFWVHFKATTRISRFERRLVVAVLVVLEVHCFGWELDR